MILVGAFFALYFTVLQPNEKTGAFNSNSESTTYINVGELLNDTTNKSYKNADETITPRTFNKANLTTLVNMISGEAGDLDDQMKSLTTSTATTPLTATDLRGKTYNKTSSQSIVVKLGNLDWIVTYVSNNSSGDLVATLWLSNNHQTAWGWDGTTVGKTALTNPINVGSYCAIINGGLYSDWSANWTTDNPEYAYPSNMYGTSYIRAETLNNGGGYVATEGASTLTTASQSESNPFALFTMSKFGLTSSLDVPDNMSWMKIFYSTKSLFGLEANNSNNSLYNVASTEDFNSNNGASYNYAGKNGYTAWKNDYLWLPSITEMGYNDGEKTYQGLWKTNATECSTYGGSTTNLTSSSNIGTWSSGSSNNGTTAYVYSWSRSAADIDAYSSFYLESTGDFNGYVDVDHTCAVRPALLLNLTSAASTIPINITLNQQSGSGGTSTVSATKGLAMSTITVPTRTGYVFGGYYTGQNGTGTQYYTAIGTSARTCDLTSATTLYAYWLAWYEIAGVTGSTTEYTIAGGARSGYKFWDLMITPASDNVISQFSFDSTNWFAVDSCSKEFYNTSAALVVRCLANEKSNAMSLMFEGVIATETIKIYLQTVSGAYSGLKATGGVMGVNVSATCGGSATLVGDDYDDLNDTDTITVSAKVTKTGYKFSKWVDSDGKTLSTNSSERFAKSLVMDSIITAVFEAEVDEYVNYELDNM